MNVLVLGSGSSEGIEGKGKSRRTQSSVLIDGKLLIDATPSINEQLSDVDCSIEAVLITHAHSDAIDGLAQVPHFSDLQVIPVYAFKHTSEIIREHLKNSKVLNHFNIVEIEPNTEIEVLDYSVFPVPVKHSVIQNEFDPTAAFMVNDFLYAEDVDYEFFLSDEAANLIELMKRAKLIFLDGAMCEGKIRGHLNIFEAAEKLSSIGIKNVVFTQIGKNCPEHEKLVEKIKSYDKTYDIACDGMSIDTEELEEFQLIHNIAEYNPKILPTKVLQDDFRIALAWYSAKKQGKDIKYTYEEILGLLKAIVNELKDRGIEFHPEKMKPYAREAFGKVVNELSQVPDFTKYIKDATLIKDFISIVGSSVEKKDYNDIDILIRLSEPTGFIKRAVETRLYKMFPEELSDKLHFIWGDAEGPHDSFVPIFDLQLKALEPKVIEMSESILFKPFYPMKPIKKFYIVKDAVDYCFSKSNIWAAEKKYNGFRAVIHKKGDEVKIYSDQKKDITEAFPTAVAQLKSATIADVILDSELVGYDGKEPLGRSYLAKFIGAVKSGKKLDDSHIKFHIFDCLYYDEDLTNKKWFERQKYLSKLKFSDNIKRVEPIIASTPEELYKAVRMMASLTGSEGCMIKRYDGLYTPNKESDYWVKYRTLLPLRVIVFGINKVKNTDAVNYSIGVLIPKEMRNKINSNYIVEHDGRYYHYLGNTFNTSIKVSEGSILDILVEEVWRHRHQDGTIHYSLHKPRVHSVSEFKVPDSTTKLDEYVVGRGVEVEASDTTSADVSGTPFTAYSLLPAKIKKKTKTMSAIPDETTGKGEEIGIEVTDFPKQFQKEFLENKEKWNSFVMQWHYRGHVITDEERKKDNIPERYIYRMNSLHCDFRLKVNDHLNGFTLLSPTSTDPEVPDLVNENLHDVRAVLKLPQPVGWLKVEGISPVGAPGTTRKAPAVFVIVATGKYRTVTAEDHKIVVELKPDSGKINKAVFETADKEGILIERFPGDELKKLPKYISLHIAHIGDKHIILVDGVELGASKD